MKRYWILGILFFFCMQGSAGAVANTTNDMVAKAQQYGIVYAKKSTQDFLKPWTTYEEEAISLTEHTERAYIYTPYLLIASDAREKQNDNKTISLADSKGLLKDYEKTMTFQVILYGKKADFAQGITATITQGKTVKKAYQMIVPDKAETVSEGQYCAQCYFYFDEEDLALNQSIVLNVAKKDGTKKKFNFALAQIY
ncbi:MAG: hypothetical protein J6K70_02220 [Selenomonadales bacterium]|nr:hypothetical protein [Selenomonadales bacterium]